jgi:hypothetical protein
LWYQLCMCLPSCKRFLDFVGRSESETSWTARAFECSSSVRQREHGTMIVCRCWGVPVPSQQWLFFHTILFRLRAKAQGDWSLHMSATWVYISLKPHKCYMRIPYLYFIYRSLSAKNTNGNVFLDNSFLFRHEYMSSVWELEFIVCL